MRAGWRLAAAVVVGLMLVAEAASAAPIVAYLDSDADFLAQSGWTKSWGMNVRNGKPGAQDWEIGIVRANDTTFAQGQVGWNATPSNNEHSVTFSYDGSRSGSIALDFASATPADTTLTFGALPAPDPDHAINTVVIRASANPNDTGEQAALSSIVISFTSGGPSISLGSLVGDNNAQYIQIQDVRFASGFTITADAMLDTGSTHSASKPMYQIKVGTLPLPPDVPEPTTLALAGLGAGAAYAGKRRRA